MNIDIELIKQGVVLLVAGMGIVYFFLAILVLVTTVAAKVIPHFAYLLPEEAPKKKPAPKADSDDTAIALAIAVARARA